MDKLLDQHEYDDVEYSLIDFSMEKKASADEVAEFIKGIDPSDSKFYLHINAMGAGEYYGHNRNGDYFPEDNLKNFYKTFETTPAHVYRHHINKNPEIAIGRVIFAYYNERMHRVELVAELDKVRAKPEYDAVLRGEYPQTSMACHTPFDTCSICGNQAHSRDEYCSHLNTQLRQLLSDGRSVHAINNGPLRFFDISIVMKPADITSSVLEKVAGNSTISGVESAEMAGVSYEPATSSITKVAIEKFSDLIKDVPGHIVRVDDTLSSILNDVHDPDESVLTTLKDFPLEDIISTFGYLSINPSLEFMLKILVSKYVGGDVSEVTLRAISELKEKGISAIPESSKELVPDLEDFTPNPQLIRVLWPYVEASSYSEEYVEKRAGYLNWEPGAGRLEPSAIRSSSTSLLKLIGGAIIAKLMITRITSALVKSAVKSKYVADLPVRLMNLSLSKDLENFL